MNKDESCCHVPQNGKRSKMAFDPILHGSTLVIVAALILYFLKIDLPHVHTFAHAVIEFLLRMWWGVALGILFVGLMSKIPREYYTAVLGRGDTFGGIVRAAIAGVFLDLCSHGILMISAKLYERGASLAQVSTFMISSPWNSLSLTIILASLIGLKWTLVYIAASMLVAVLTGMMYMSLVRAGKLPDNPNKTDLTEGFSILADMKERLETFRITGQFLKDILMGGLSESKMIVKWLLFGVVIAAAIRTFVPMDIFAGWFGPTLIGLTLTLVATTVIEVCSEGSAPIASDLVTRAAAPGNGFAFLMAGVATDYTEILVMREFTKSWKIALLLPCLTIPQVFILGYIMNGF
ncbi:MAG TPA: ATPase [Rhodospirillaceae bacterium]|nr:ATPase [Rhodospirillaceae bacterium]